MSCIGVISLIPDIHRPDIQIQTGSDTHLYLHYILYTHKQRDRRTQTNRETEIERQTDLPLVLAARELLLHEITDVRLIHVNFEVLRSLE